MKDTEKLDHKLKKYCFHITATFVILISLKVIFVADTSVPFKNVNAIVHETGIFRTNYELLLAGTHLPFISCSLRYSYSFFKTV